MSVIRPGSVYTIQDGDTPESLAARAYGDSTKSTLILQGNQIRFVAGNAITVPVDPDDVRLRTAILQDAALVQNDFNLVVDGLRIPVVAGRVNRSLDTAADAWSATVAWRPGENESVDSRLRPFSYGRASVYLGDTLAVNGVLYRVETLLDGAGSSKTLTGYSFTADAVDSTVRPPYERRNVRLEDVAAALVAPIGVKAEFDTDTGGVFERVTATKTETIFSHLRKLAAQRAVLVSNTPRGDMLFTRAATSGAPVGTLREGDSFVLSWAADFDGRKRYSAYRISGQTPLSNTVVGISTDTNVPRTRFVTKDADESSLGNIQRAADWERSKTVASALSIRLPVAGWLAPNGSLWSPNTLVTVVSPTLDLTNGFTFLIKGVEFLFSNEGSTAELSLVPPQVYTGEEIQDPWQLAGS